MSILHLCTMLKKYIGNTLAIAALLILFPASINGWGFYAHKKINRHAVLSLPPEMIGFYKHYLGYVTSHAVDPDKRRRKDPDEAPRHHIDADHYGAKPFDVIPEHWKDAVDKFSEDTLKEYGILPWHICLELERLTQALKEKDVKKILQYSADLGHYIGDACVPLHTTENYNGQLTGQKGIHGFWESRIPELKGDEYNLLVGKAYYVKHPQHEIWQVIRSSFAAKDTVLKLEETLSKSFPADLKYSFETRGKKTMKVYSKEYTEAYNKLLKGMVERRMRLAILLTSSFWYTAWENSGSPDLNSITNVSLKEFNDSTSHKSPNLPSKRKKNDQEHDE